MNVTDKKHALRMFTNGVYILTSRSDEGFGEGAPEFRTVC